MQLVPNQLIELHVEDLAGPQIYRTRVEDVYDDLLIVGAPLRKGTLVPIRIGTRLQVQFKMSGTAKEGRFQNEAIVERRIAANVPLLQLRLLDKWIKIQERGFVRVPVFIDAVFVPLSAAANKTEQEGPVQTGIILNLSGGGFLLRSDYSFTEDEKIRVTFKIEGNQIVVEAQLARIVPTEDGQDYGFFFLDISEQLRTTIIRFVFRRQIELADLADER